MNWISLKTSRPAPKTACVVLCVNGRKFLAVADPEWVGGFCTRNYYFSKAGRSMFKDSELGSPVTHWFRIPDDPKPEDG